VGLFTDRAVWEMPPFPEWYTGPVSIARLIDTKCPGQVHDMIMLPTSANGQPAFGLYMKQEDGSFVPFHLQVLTLEEEKVSHVGAFFDTSLFELCGLPPSLPAGSLPAGSLRAGSVSVDEFSAHGRAPAHGNAAS